MREPVELDAEAIIDTLNRHGVRYVVIGGYAALLHGSPRTTDDLDITPAGDQANLERFGAALGELRAGLLPPGSSESVPWPWSPQSVAAFTTLSTRTSAGDLGICLRPDAPGGRQFQFADLEANAVVISLPPDVPVASLEDVIASKAASGRDKDERNLPELRDLLQARLLLGDGAVQRHGEGRPQD